MAHLNPLVTTTTLDAWLHSSGPLYLDWGLTGNTRNVGAGCRCYFSITFATIAVAQAQKRIALLIGNKAYDPSVGVLKNPHNDVAVVGEALAKQGLEVLPPIKDARRSTVL